MHLLLSAKANLNIANACGNTALSVAALGATVSLLLASGAEYGTVNATGDTTLELAAWHWLASQCACYSLVHEVEVDPAVGIQFVRISRLPICV